MSRVLKIGLIILAVVIFAGALFFAGQTYPRAQVPGRYRVWGLPMMGGRGWDGGEYGYGPMMRGRGHWNNDDRIYGRMMGRAAPGFGFGSGYTANTAPLSIEDSKVAAQSYLDKLNTGGLGVGEIMIFDNNAYVVIEETQTGIGAFELLVDPVSKTAYPEFGPNMMWNLKYGGMNHSRMMGSAGMGWMMNSYDWNRNSNPPDINADMTITKEQAVLAAQTYLDKYLPGNTASQHVTQFYGYYTLDFEYQGTVTGMLSVNGFDGDVFVHSWHGTFIEESE